MAHRARLPRRHQRELVDRQWPYRTRRHHHGEPLAVALLDVAQKTTVDLGVAAGPPGRRALDAADGAATGREQQRIERAVRSVAQLEPARRVVNRHDRALHELSTGLLGDRGERHPVRAAERERFRDCHRPECEIRVGRDQFQADPLILQRVQRQERLQTSDAAAHDHDLHATKISPIRR